MPATIPSLWPEDIKVDVRPPLTILKVQAAKIREITRGILHGEVTTVTGSDDFVSHRLDLIAPALDGRRQRLMTATHRTDLYPVVLEADCFKPKPSIDPFTLHAAILEALEGKVSPPWPDPEDWRPIASNQDELLKHIGEVLKSRTVRAAIDSMIALSNEKNQADDGEVEATT